MKDYVLVSDSTADLTPSIVKELGVEIVPFTYSINDELYHYYLDERDGDISDFYSKLKRGAMPVTSQANPAVYKDFFEEKIKQGKDIVYLCFSSGLSGSYQTSVLAIDMLKEKYPDANIVSIDSLCASVGEGILLYLAANMKKDGATMDELVSWIEDNKLNIRHWFMVEDLFHLKRGGRLSTVEAVVGSALKIKPILSVDEKGKLFVKSKTRGTGKAFEYLVSKFVEEGGDLASKKIIVGHADSPEKAVKLRDMLVDAGAVAKNIFIAPVGPIIGTHVGAGMMAVTFLQDK